MRLKETITVVVLGIGVAFAVPVHSQSNPAGERHGLPLFVGVGYSNFDLDFGHGRRMEGVDVWANYYLYYAPSFLNRLGLDVEGRDLDFGRPTSLPNMREDTLQGGVNVRLYSRTRFRVFTKFLAGTARISYPPGAVRSTNKTSATDGVYSVGGGIDYKATRNVWLRGDYETQWWPDLFNRGTSLTPSGLTLGVSYSFENLHGRQE